MGTCLKCLTFEVLAIFCVIICTSAFTEAAEQQFNELLSAALKKNPEILMNAHKAQGARHRIYLSSALPDPMFMFGYQNEGWSRFTYGEMQGAQWMFSVSQMVPFPGKLTLKTDIATKESEAINNSLEDLRIKIALRVYELYYDLFLARKTLEFLRNNKDLFEQMEEAALSRLSTGVLMQEDVLSVQREKYMLLERELMLGQRIVSLEGMLNSLANRDIDAQIGAIPDLNKSDFPITLSEALKTAQGHSFELKAKGKAIDAWKSRIELAKKEYLPDFTVNASIYPRSGPFLDMWSLSLSMNIPLFYKTKQRQGVHESEAMTEEAKYDLEASRSMIASSIRENMAMIGSSERIMDLYKQALVPKNYQDFENALAYYRIGRLSTLSLIEKAKYIIDAETAYWTQLVQREKAIVRVKALMGTLLQDNN